MHCARAVELILGLISDQGGAGVYGVLIFGRWRFYLPRPSIRNRDEARAKSGGSHWLLRITDSGILHLHYLFRLGGCGYSHR